MSLPRLAPAVVRESIFSSEPETAGIEPQSWQSLANHGNWCGYNNTRSDPNYPVVDAVDRVCRAHDLCVKNGHKCSCDSRFISDMRGAVAAPGVGARGRAYGVAAISAFQLKPCYCDVKIPTPFGRRSIRVPGTGGRCGAAPHVSPPSVPVPRIPLPRIPVPRLPSIPTPRIPRPRW